MLIPAGATVSTFYDTEPGSLLIGSIDSEKPNFIGLCVDYKNNLKEGRFIVVLNSWEFEKGLQRPYRISFDPGPVLSLGRDWWVDVNLTPTIPNFSRRVGPLCFSEDKFYLLVQDSLHGTYDFLDMKAGIMGMISLNGGCAYWPTFRIMLAESEMSDQATEIFAWPEPQNDPAKA